MILRKQMRVSMTCLGRSHLPVHVTELEFSISLIPDDVIWVWWSDSGVTYLNVVSQADAGSADVNSIGLHGHRCENLRSYIVIHVDRLLISTFAYS